MRSSNFLSVVTIVACLLLSAILADRENLRATTELGIGIEVHALAADISSLADGISTSVKTTPGKPVVMIPPGVTVRAEPSPYGVAVNYTIANETDDPIQYYDPWPDDVVPSGSWVEFRDARGESLLPREGSPYPRWNPWFIGSDVRMSESPCAPVSLTSGSKVEIKAPIAPFLTGMTDATLDKVREARITWIVHFDEERATLTKPRLPGSVYPKS